MKRFIILFVISFLGIFFTACGGTLNTTVELEQDMSGRRVMEYEVSKEDFQEYSNVSIAVVEQQVSQNCPEGWTYEFKQTQDSYILTFTMPFSSVEDAMERMEAVTGTPGSCEISCYQAEGVFCEGFSYEEQFEAESLFEWFKDVLVNCGCVDLTYLTYIINESETKLVYDGNQYYSDDTLVVKDFSYIPIDNIEISTYVNGDGTYNRKITMSVQEMNLNKRADKIRKFMEASIPDGGSGEWTESYGMHTHTVTMQNLSAEEMQEAMQTYTHSEETVFETREHESDDEAYALLTREISYAEYLDFREYGSSAEGEVNVNYVQENENMKGELYFCLNEFKDWKISNIFGDEWRFWNFENKETDKVGDGIQIYPLYYLSRVSLVYRGVYYFDVTEVEWDTEVHSKDQIETSLSFILAESTFEEETDALILSCRHKIEEEDLEGVTVEKTQVKGNPVVIFTFTGNDTGINHARKVLTQTEDADKDVMDEVSALACFEEDNLFDLKKTIVFEESVWPEGFLAPPESYGTDITVFYSLTVAGKEFSNQEGVPSSVFYGGEYKDEVRVGVIHETANLSAFLLIGAIVFGFASIVTGIVLIAIGMIKKRKVAEHKKAWETVAVPPMPEKTSELNQNTPSNDVAEQLAADLFGQDSDKSI